MQLVRNSEKAPSKKTHLASLPRKSVLQCNVCITARAQTMGHILGPRPEKGLQENNMAIHVFLIRNHFISNLVLDRLKLKKLLELQGKS